MAEKNPCDIAKIPRESIKHVAVVGSKYYAPSVELVATIDGKDCFYTVSDKDLTAVAKLKDWSPKMAKTKLHAKPII